MSLPYFSHARKEILQFVPAGITDVLDIGCGAGLFGELLQREFLCKVTGVEPAPEAFAQAQKRLHQAFCSTAEEFIALHNGTYDVVFFNDVLEHLLDPWAQLSATRHLLRQPRGAIVASIPNIRNYSTLKEIVFDGDFKYRDAGILDRTHLRFFTRKSIVRMFQGAGYSVEVCEGINGMCSKRCQWVNRLTLGYFKDLLYGQFVIVARQTQGTI